MHSHKSLVAWRCAHRLCVDTYRATDKAYHPKCRPLFDQTRRAAVSVVAHVVEGYALGTKKQFRRHLRIALASAAELECLFELIEELGYMDREAMDRLDVWSARLLPRSSV